MKTKEIIKNVCIFLGKEELLDCNLFNQSGDAPTASQLKEVDRIINCLNLITNEIASDYIPILKEKTVEFTDAKINVSDIDENIQEIVSIKSLNGRNLRYRYIQDQIICLVTKAVICYKVYPNLVEGLNDDAQTFGGKLSARVLAYGVASEYCNLEMMYDDATIWETRFKNALLFASRKKGEIVLKKRGWF